MRCACTDKRSRAVTPGLWYSRKTAVYSNEHTATALKLQGPLEYSRFTHAHAQALESAECMLLMHAGHPASPYQAV